MWQITRRCAHLAFITSRLPPRFATSYQDIYTGLRTRLSQTGVYGGSALFVVAAVNIYARRTGNTGLRAAAARQHITVR